MEVLKVYADTWYVKQVETRNLPPYVIGYYKKCCFCKDRHIIFSAVGYAFTLESAQTIRLALEQTTTVEDYARFDVDASDIVIPEGFEPEFVID
jgi:hypothetical protein